MSLRPASAAAPARYRIHVEGTLDPHWSDWLGGMAITYDGGDTLLTGALADQAALYGVLQRLRDLGLVLVALTREQRLSTEYDAVAARRRCRPL